MAQRDTYNLLKELGGKAELGEIKKYAKKKFPDASLHTYVVSNLEKLEKWGRVRMSEYKKGKTYWEIIREY